MTVAWATGAPAKSWTRPSKLPVEACPTKRGGAANKSAMTITDTAEARAKRRRSVGRLTIEHYVFGECGRRGRNQGNRNPRARRTSSAGSGPENSFSCARKKRLRLGFPASVAWLARSLRRRGKTLASPGANLKRKDAQSIQPPEGRRAPTRRSMICPDLLPFGLYRRPRNFTGSWKNYRTVTSGE